MAPVLTHILILSLILSAIFQYFRIGSYEGDEYPRKPIRVIVPFEPGGGSDTFVRIVQKAVNDSALMPQPLVVVNKPGGGTSIGSSYAKDARADGYTVLVLHEALIVAKSTGQSPNGPNDYEAAAATGEFGAVIIVSGNSPYESLGALMAAAKEQPETLKFGLNLNTPSHFNAIALENTSPGARFRFVATGGGADRLSGVMGGHLDVIILSVGEYTRFRQNGLKALAYLGEERIESILDIPTGKELGFPVFSGNLHYWWFPKGTDQTIVDYFAGVLAKVMKTDYVQQRTKEMEVLPRIIVGDELNTRIKQRTEIFDLIKPQSRVDLPDFTLWTLVSVGFFSLIVFGKQWLRPKSNIPKSDAPRLRYDMAFGTFFMTIVYVLLMGLRIAPFVWATIVFILASGLLLTRCDKRKFVYVLEIALIMSFGLHFVFAQLFTIDLP